MLSIVNLMETDDMKPGQTFPALVLWAIAAVSSQGCGPTNESERSFMLPKEQQSSDPKSSWLRVVTDSREIQQAREIARRSTRSRFERVFSAMSDSFYIDSETMSLLAAHRDEATKRLTTVLGDQISDDGVGAALLLCRLREPLGRDYVRRALQSGTVEQRRRILNGIDGVIFDEDEKQAYRGFLFADEELVSALLRRLGDSNDEIVKAAIQCCGYLEVPGANAQFLDLLERSNAPDRGRILFWLSKGELTEEVFTYAVRAFDASDPDERWGVSIFEAFARLPSGPLKSRAQDQLRGILDQWPDDGSQGYRGDRLSLLTTLAESASGDDLSWVRQLAKNEGGLYAVAPLVAWIRLAPDEGRSVLLKWVHDEERRRTAVEAAGTAYRNSEDAEVVDQLANIAKESEGRQLSAICSSLNSIGGDAAHQAIEDVAQGLDPAELARFRQTADAIQLQEITRALQVEGLLTTEELNAATERIASPDQSEEQRPPGLFDVLYAADSALAFDVETGMLPCRHDELVDSFAKASRGRFDPAAVHEQWHQDHEEDFDAPYTLQFVFDNRLYRGEIRNLGDWYDVERVVAMINSALADSAVQERFVALAAEGQIALFVFADPDKLLPLAKQFNMAISDDLADAMKKGIEFEEYVLERLKTEPAR